MKKSIWDNSYIQLRYELREIRKEANLTQIELANKLQKHQSYVSKYENGDRNLDFIEVIQVCIACKEKPEDFIKKFSIN